MNKIAFTILAGLSFGLVFGANPAQAAAGSLDPTFGQGGIAQTSGFSTIVFTTAVLQPDGSIVINFTDDQTTQFTSGLVRYLSSGVLDSSFGNGGFVSLPAGTSGGSLALQSDGKILLAGVAPTNGSQFVVTRFNTNGTVDTSFGSGGEATVTIGVPNVGQALLVQTDGRIVLGVTLEEVGRGQSFRTGLARFNTNGSVDTAFGSGGTVIISNGIFGCTALAELSDGEILALNGGSIEQFTANGALESTVTGGSPVAKSANIFQTDGRYIVPKLVFVGAARNKDEDTQVVRFSANGAVDSTFNSPILDFSGEGGSGQLDNPQDAALQSNNQVVVVGAHAQISTTAALNGLARLNINGSLDTTFGNGGIVANNLPAGTNGLHHVLIQPDGKILGIGTAINNSVLFVERYLAQ